MNLHSSNIANQKFTIDAGLHLRTVRNKMVRTATTMVTVVTVRTTLRHLAPKMYARCKNTAIT